MKANVWRVTGYRGKNDYDGPADDNTKLDILFDGRLKKEDVEDILFYYWGKKYRSVAIKAELLEEIERVSDVNEILNKLAKEPAYCHDGEDFYNGVCAVEGELMCLEPVELEEPKQATKGLHLGHQYYCSNCGVLTYMHNYCASCGAKVVKETD